MTHEHERPLHERGREEGAHDGHKHGGHEHHEHHGEHEPHHHGPWKLNGQGMIIESQSPETVVRQPIKQPGFNPDTAAIAVLKGSAEPTPPADPSFPSALHPTATHKLTLPPTT